MPEAQSKDAAAAPVTPAPAPVTPVNAANNKPPEGFFARTKNILNDADLKGEEKAMAIFALIMAAIIKLIAMLVAALISLFGGKKLKPADANNSVSTTIVEFDKDLAPKNKNTPALKVGLVAGNTVSEGESLLAKLNQLLDPNAALDTSVAQTNKIPVAGDQSKPIDLLPKPLETIREALAFIANARAPGNTTSMGGQDHLVQQLEKAVVKTAAGLGLKLTPDVASTNSAEDETKTPSMGGLNRP